MAGHRKGRKGRRGRAVWGEGQPIGHLSHPETPAPGSLPGSEPESCERAAGHAASARDGWAYTEAQIIAGIEARRSGATWKATAAAAGAKAPATSQRC
jgi:hypothetical protein